MQTTLLDFIKNLLEKGEVTVSRDLTPFTDEDQSSAVAFLHEIYQKDRLELPYEAPGFNEESALWSANYLYKAIQCSLMRDLEIETVKEMLQPFEGEQTADTIYSVDLVLRYLPDLWNLAKGLSPDDILVVLLRRTAEKWPFSSIGIKGLEELELNPILEHPSLRLAYVDRVIKANDNERLADDRIIPIAKEILGEYTATLAPQLKSIFEKSNT